MQLYKLGEDKIIAKVNYIDICTLRWQEVERELYIYVNLFIHTHTHPHIYINIIVIMICKLTHVSSD